MLASNINNVVSELHAVLLHNNLAVTAHATLQPADVSTPHRDPQRNRLPVGT